MNSYYLLDWIGAVTALIGTYVLAFNVSWSRWGWVVYFYPILHGFHTG